MKILVTGATGSLGSRLLDRWVGKHELTGTGRKEKNLPRVRFARGDLADASFTREVVKGHEVVVHCAALASAWGPWEDFYSANVVATQNIVDACLESGVKQLVHISTPSVYFAPEDRLGIKESDPLPRPATFYAKSKLMADEIVVKAKGKGLETVRLRPRGIIAPNDQVVLPKIIRLVRKGRFPLVRGGIALLDLTYVDNVLHAIDLCLERKPGIDGAVFNISNGEPISVRALVDIVAKYLNTRVTYIPIPLSLSQGLAGIVEQAWKISGKNGEPPITRYGLGLLSYHQTLDLTQARERLGYRVEVPLKAGILTSLEHMR
jgi:nucleoside-diphosphate-sugar epimerase